MPFGVYGSFAVSKLAQGKQHYLGQLGRGAQRGARQALDAGREPNMTIPAVALAVAGDRDFFITSRETASESRPFQQGLFTNRSELLLFRNQLHITRDRI